MYGYINKDIFQSSDGIAMSDAIAEAVIAEDDV